MLGRVAREGLSEKMTFDMTDDGYLLSLEPIARVGDRERLTFKRVSDL